MTDTPPVPWEADGWLAQVQSWVAVTLAGFGIELAGELTQPHVRPWSTVLHVPTSAGDYYFKATMPHLSHEVALAQAIASWQPHDTLPVLAVDVERGWMLMPAGGTTLRQMIRADRDLGHWARLLPVYAELQIALAGRIPALLALGIPDRRLEMLPQLYAQLLQRADALGVGQPEGLTPAEVQQLQALTPAVATRCAQLASYGVPESLHHGDLHDGNIFLSNGSLRLFDWGDSCVTHPFFSLRTAWVSVEISLGLEEGAAEFEPLRDAYLTPWMRYAALPELRVALSCAQPLAAICGALAWDRVVSRLAMPQRAAYAAPVPALLRELLQGVQA